MKKAMLYIVLLFVALGVIRSGVTAVQDALRPTPQEYLNDRRGACIEDFNSTLDYGLTIEEMCDERSSIGYLTKYKGRLTDEEDLFFFE